MGKKNQSVFILIEIIFICFPYWFILFLLGKKTSPEHRTQGITEWGRFTPRCTRVDQPVAPTLWGEKDYVLASKRGMRYNPTSPYTWTTEESLTNQLVKANLQDVGEASSDWKDLGSRHLRPKKKSNNNKMNFSSRFLVKETPDVWKDLSEINNFYL